MINFFVLLSVLMMSTSTLVIAAEMTPAEIEVAIPKEKAKSVQKNDHKTADKEVVAEKVKVKPKEKMRGYIEMPQRLQPTVSKGLQ